MPWHTGERIVPLTQFKQEMRDNEIYSSIAHAVAMSYSACGIPPSLLLGVDCASEENDRSTRIIYGSCQAERIKIPELKIKITKEFRYSLLQLTKATGKMTESVNKTTDAVDAFAFAMYAKSPISWQLHMFILAQCRKADRKLNAKIESARKYADIQFDLIKTKYSIK